MDFFDPYHHHPFLGKGKEIIFHSTHVISCLFNNNSLSKPKAFVPRKLYGAIYLFPIYSLPDPTKNLKQLSIKTTENVPGHRSQSSRMTACDRGKLGFFIVLFCLFGPLPLSSWNLAPLVLHSRERKAASSADMH